MKLDVIARSGRKKDYWDIHEIATKISLPRMLELHKERYPYTHNPELIITKLQDFRLADNDFDPICLLGKYWEIIKLDLTELSEK